MEFCEITMESSNNTLESSKIAGMGPRVGVRRALEKRITPETQANRPAKDCKDPGRVASILGKEKDFPVPEWSGEGEPRRRLRRSAGEFAAPGRRSPYWGGGRCVAGCGDWSARSSNGHVRTVACEAKRKNSGAGPRRSPLTPIISLLQETGSGDTTGAGRRCCLRFRLPPTPA